MSKFREREGPMTDMERSPHPTAVEDDLMYSHFDELDWEDDPTEISLDQWRTILSGGNATLSTFASHSGRPTLSDFRYAFEEEDLSGDNDFDNGQLLNDPFVAKAVHPSLQTCSPRDRFMFDCATGPWTAQRYPELEMSNFNSRVLQHSLTHPLRSSNNTDLRQTTRYKGTTSQPKANREPHAMEIPQPTPQRRNHVKILFFCWIAIFSMFLFLFVNHFITVHIINSITGTSHTSLPWYSSFLTNVLETFLAYKEPSTRARQFELKTQSAQHSFQKNDNYVSSQWKTVLPNTFALPEDPPPPPTPVPMSNAITGKELSDAVSDGGFWRWRLMQHRRYMAEFAKQVLARTEGINCQNDTQLMASSACYFEGADLDSSTFNFVSFGTEGDPYGPRQYAAHLRQQEEGN